MAIDYTRRIPRLGADPATGDEVSDRPDPRPAESAGLSTPNLANLTDFGPGHHHHPMATDTPVDDAINGPRTDLKSAIEQAPTSVRQAISNDCREAFDLLAAHLPRDERVLAVYPASAQYLRGSTNSIFVLTAKRVLFVAPAPQVLSWRLAELTKFQIVNGGPIQIAAGGDEYMMGDDLADSYSDAFEALVKYSVAVARLRGE